MPFLQYLSYHSVQLDVLMDDPRGTAFVRRCLEDVARLGSTKVITPIVDRVFAARDIEQAFRYLMSGKHKGKIVVDFSRENWPSLQSLRRSSFHIDTLYVISGGLGAIGWETVKWMSTEGAYRFLLLSRQGSSALTESQKEDLNLLQAKGVRVHVQKADVTNSSHVKLAYEEARAQGLLESRVAILHMAMVLQDRPISKMNTTELHQALACKIDGARNLVEYFQPTSRDVSVDFVVLFSSISSALATLIKPIMQLETVFSINTPLN
jgi:fatty acid synthase